MATTDPYTQTPSTAYPTGITSVATTSATTTSPAGYTTVAQANAIVTAVNAIIDQLELQGVVPKV